MGGAKRLAEIEEDKRRIAVEIAVEAGELRRCEGHDYALDAGGDGTAAYKLANALITRGDPLVAIFQGNRRALTDLIREVLSDHGSHCPGCEAAMRG